MIQAEDILEKFFKDECISRFPFQPWVRPAEGKMHYGHLLLVHLDGSFDDPDDDEEMLDEFHVIEMPHDVHKEWSDTQDADVVDDYISDHTSWLVYDWHHFMIFYDRDGNSRIEINVGNETHWKDMFSDRQREHYEQSIEWFKEAA